MAGKHLGFAGLNGQATLAISDRPLTMHNMHRHNDAMCIPRAAGDPDGLDRTDQTVASSHSGVSSVANGTASGIMECNSSIHKVDSSVQTHAVLLLQVQRGDHLLEVGSDHEGSWAVLLFAAAGITTAGHLQVLQIQL